MRVKIKVPLLVQGLGHWAWTLIRAPYTVYEGIRDAWRNSTLCDVCLSEGAPGEASVYCTGCFGMACERHRVEIEEGAIRACCEGPRFRRVG